MRIMIVEWIWVSLALFGLFFASWTFNEAWKDFKYLNKQGIKNGRHLLAKTTMYQDGVRALVHFFFLLIGVMVISDSPYAGIVARWGFILCATLLVSQSYVSRRVRLRLVREERHRLMNERIAENIRSKIE